MCTTDDEVCRLHNMFCKVKYIAFKIKILTVLLLCRSSGNKWFVIRGFLTKKDWATRNGKTMNSCFLLTVSWIALVT